MKRNNVRKLIIITLVAVMAIGIPFMSGCLGKPAVSPEPQEKVFKFGLLYPFSGPYGFFGDVVYPSHQIWEEEVNEAGGILVGGVSYMVDIVKYDSKADPSVALTLARKMIYDEGVKYGNCCCLGEISAINPLTAENKVIMLNCGCGTAPEGFCCPDSPYTFQTYVEEWELTWATLRVAHEEHPEYTRIGALHPNNAMGVLAKEQLQEVVAESEEFTLVENVTIPEDETDFYSSLTAMLDKDVDIIVITVFGYEQGGLIIKQADELGFDKQIILQDTMDMPTLKGITSVESMEGVIVGNTLETMPTDTGKRWAAKYKELTGGMVYWAGTNYEALKLLKLAIEKVDSFDADLVAQALGEVECEGLVGRVSFGKNRFTPDLPRYLKMEIGTSIIRNGELVDVAHEFSPIWDY